MTDIELFENRIKAAREARLADDGGLFEKDPSEITVQEFSARETALRLADPLKFMAMQRQMMIKAYETLMIPNQDYGTVQGCGNKPMLFKAGAEKAANLFNLSIQVQLIKDIEDWDKEFFSYTYKAIIRNRQNHIVAECEGNCNSKEKKYRYRWIPERFATEEQKKTAVARKESEKYPGSYNIHVQNPDICDQVNTIMKMSQKRAIVGGVLIATNTSAFFGNAELEMRNDFEAPSDRPTWDTIDAEVVQDDKPTFISEPQRTRLWTIATKAGHNKNSLKAMVATFGIESSKEIPVDQYEVICKQAENVAMAQFWVSQTQAKTEPTPALD